MGTYTDRMEEMLFAGYGYLDDEKDNTSKIVDLLNSDEGFRSFGDGILSFINRDGSNVTASDAPSFVTKCCKDNGIDMKDVASPNTLKNWFSKDKRPKKGEQSRESMFALSFALGLSVEETSQFFHKVYLDRAFDLRNTHELVYYFCLSNRFSWSHANELIAKSDSISSDSNDNTIYTSKLKADMDKLDNEDELLDYIKNHQHNFNKRNTAAKKNAEQLLSEAKSVAQKEASLPEHEGQYIGKWSRGDEISINLLYEIITDYSPSGESGTTSIFKGSRFPDEIRNRFPEAVNFSEKEPTYESLRKKIIFLASYVFWYNMQWEHGQADFDDYSEYMNNLLAESGMSELYYGNPYDWLFLYCTLSDRPLDTFREILYEVNNYD